MIKLATSLLLMILFGQYLCNAQNNQISIENYLHTLSNRVYYYGDDKEDKLGYNYDYYFNLNNTEKTKLKIFRYQTGDTTLYKRLNALNDFYIWIPDYEVKQDPFYMELPGSKDVFFAHNNKPFATTSEDYHTIKSEVARLRSDVYQFNTNDSWIRNYNDGKYISAVFVGGGFGYLAYRSFHLKTTTTLEQVGANSLGLLLTFFSIGGVIIEIQNFFKFKRLQKQQSQIIQRFNYSQ